MADYIYLLENRLSKSQRSALSAVQQVARARGVTIFLVGGAVRDLTSGSPVRDLDVAVQGSASKLRKDIELAGGFITGSHDVSQSLFVRFAGSVRMEIGSTMSVTFPKPGRGVWKAATILEDLRRRDFTANAMALSLNEGSFGLLMDPLNGVADIENRELRLVSNYGFIEDPVRMIRAARFGARLGWELEEKTRTRYETGKQESYINSLDDYRRGYEAEEIFHEEDPLRVMRRLEAEGWLPILAPGWTTAKANVPELEKVREAQTQLQMQDIHPDTSAINFPLLTAKLDAKQVQALKKSFPRQGFVSEIDAAEGEAKELATALSSRAASVPSAAYRMIGSAKPEALLHALYSTKSTTLQARLKSFLTEWPQVRQKIPFALMQEMRITPEIAGYDELVETLFFELMDGKLATAEEMKGFLEPFSPPAPPPPVHVRRSRATKKEAKGKGKTKKDLTADLDDEEEVESGDAEADGEELVRGAEEDEEAEDAAEDFNAVAELGGSPPERKDVNQEEEEEEEDAVPVAPRKAPPVKTRPPAAEKQTIEPTAPTPITEKVEALPTDKVPGKAKKSAGKVGSSPMPTSEEKARPARRMNAPAPDRSRSAAKEPSTPVKVPKKAEAAPAKKKGQLVSAKAVAPKIEFVPQKRGAASGTVKQAPAKQAKPPAKKVAVKKGRS